MMRTADEPELFSMSLLLGTPRGSPPRSRIRLWPSGGQTTGGARLCQRRVGEGVGTSTTKSGNARARCGAVLDVLMGGGTLRPGDAPTRAQKAWLCPGPVLCALSLASSVFTGTWPSRAAGRAPVASTATASAVARDFLATAKRTRIFLPPDASPRAAPAA
jgi:hypothetical protein